MVTKIDRRVQRTRELLQRSLLSLVLERGYESLVIQDITDHANLSRAAFYLHYRDKEELLWASVEEVFSELLEIAPENVPEENPYIALFNHVAERPRLYRVIVGGRGTPNISERLRTFLAIKYVHCFENAAELMPGQSPPSQVMEIIDSYVSGAVLALIGWWLDNDQPYSVEQMAEVADDLSLSAMTRLERVTEIASGLPSATTANG